MSEAVKFPVLQAVLQKNISGSLTTSALSALKPSKLSSYSGSTSDDADLPLIGGVLKDGYYSWLARGSILVTVLTKTNSVVSIYDFNQIFEELRFVITVCCMCQNLIIVGLKSQDGRGCVAVYNPFITRLLKTIGIPYPVTALDLVSFQGGAVCATRCLYKSLRWFFGIVAVGTEKGHLYLLDLRFDGPDGVDSVPSNVEIALPTSRDVPKTREEIVAACGYLAFELQASSHEEGIFHYAFPDDEILESYYPSDVSITSLLYESRVASLFIGFNFGQFQIVSLQSLNLVFSSDLEGNNEPVCQFSFQEPENDPRKYCYLWVAKGQETPQSSRAPLTLSMFQLCYSKKEILTRPNQEPERNALSKSAKILYKDFETCCLRFQHSLGHGFISTYPDCRGSVLHMCLSVEKYALEAEPLELPDEEDVDYCLSPSTSFCIFGWQSLKGKRVSSPELNIIVFDINRWYIAQMPQRFCGDEDDFLFAGYWSFDESQSSFAEDETVLGMHVSKERIRHFTSGKRPLPERYYLPSACSFSLHCLTNLSIKQYCLYGHQQQVLNIATKEKSKCLISPKQLHGDMLASELWSKHSRNQAITPDMMRENILSAALEHGQVAFLISVVRDLSDGHLAACGCTLRFVMDWAWKSVAFVKSVINELCVPVFDCTAAALDPLIRSHLQFSMTQIQHLWIIFQKLTEYTEDSSDQSKLEMNTKLNVVTLIHQYLKAMQWFINTGLLPEQFDKVSNDDEIMTSSGIFIYKYSRLRQVFDGRRNELKRLNTPDLLLIDGWIEEIGEPLTSRWTKEEGGKPNYPPPSLMALLDMYYIDCVDIAKKHCLVMYLLYEIMAVFSALDTEDEGPNSDLRRERLGSMACFLEMFSVPAGLKKLTQGYWLLDHQHFEEALAIFIDADTCFLESSGQERRILRSFLCQGHPTMALKYISVRHPKVETLGDAKMHVTIYVESREPLKAWNLVQISSGQHDTGELFSHLFALCQRHSQLDLLLKLPLTAAEEEMVVNYLKESDSPDSTQILVLFYLQKSKYVEAIKLHSQSKHIRLARDQSEESRRRNAKLDHIVQAYSNLLPKIEREVTFTSNLFLKPRVAVQREVHKPSLHPVVFHPVSHFELSCRTSRLVSFMERTEQEKRSAQEPLTTPLRRRTLGPRMTATDTLFPTAKRRSSVELQGSMGRRSSFGSPVQSSVFHDSRAAVSLSASAQKTAATLKDRRVSSLSVVSTLLQTPPITKRRPSAVDDNLSRNLQTPQSILKVKKLVLPRRDRNLISADASQTSPGFDEKTVKLKYRDDAMESGSDTSGSENHIKREIPAVKTPCATDYQNPDPFYCDVTPACFQEDQQVMNREIPTISTPSARSLHYSDLKRFKFRNEGTSAGFDTPKRLRFAGLDSSAADSDLSVIGFPAQHAAALAPDVVVADSDEMDVDVTGDSLDGEEKEGLQQIVVAGTAVREKELIEVSSFTQENEDLADKRDEANASDKEAEEDITPPFQDQESQLQCVEEKDSDSDQIISLDSSEKSEDVQEEERGTEEAPQKEGNEYVFRGGEEAANEVGDMAGPTTTSSEEEHLKEQDVLEGTYGSEEFTVEPENGRDVLIPALLYCPPPESMHPEKITLISDDEWEDDEDEKEHNVPVLQEDGMQVEKSNVEFYDASVAPKSITKEDVFFGQISPDNQDAEKEANDELEPNDSDPEQGKDQQEKVLAELFIPSLSYQQQQGDIEILISDNDSKITNAEQEEVEKLEGLEKEPLTSEKQGDYEESPDVCQQDKKATSALVEESEPSTSAHVMEEVQDSPSVSYTDEEDQGLRLHLSSTDDESFSALKEEPPLDGEVLVEPEKEMKEDVSGSRERKDSVQDVEESEQKLERGAVEQDEKYSEPCEELSKKNEQDVPHGKLPGKEEEEIPHEVVSGRDEQEVLHETLPCEGGEVVPCEEMFDERDEKITGEELHSKGGDDVKELDTEKEPTERKSSGLNEERAMPQVGILVHPPTPTVERIKTDPEYVLSPPTVRRSKRKTSRGTQYTPKSVPIEKGKATTSPTRATRFTSVQTHVAQSPVPTFTFTPPATRSRSSRKKEKSIISLATELDASRLSPQTSTKRTRRKTRSSDKDSSSSASPARRSVRKKLSELDETTQRSPVKELALSTSPNNKPPLTPTRRTRQSPGRKHPHQTPTRSSSRIRAKASLASGSEVPPVPSEVEITLSSPKRVTRRETSGSSNTATSDAESEGPPTTPARRSTRKYLARMKLSPNQDTLKIPELTPLSEEKEVTSSKKRKEESISSTQTTSARVTRLTSTYATRMRRKAKIHSGE